MVKYAYLLDDPDVRRWHDNLAAGAQITADISLRCLGRYCVLQNNITPKQILKQAATKELKNVFLDFIRKQEEKGSAGSYLVHYKKMLKSWIAHNGVKADSLDDVKIKAVDATPTLDDERVPSKEELAKILRKSTDRGRVAASLMAYSGLRPESVGDYQGTDGIRLGDFPEAEITKDGIEFKKIPSLLIIRWNLSKMKRQYFTFIPQETATYIKEYLEKRVNHGEELRPQTPLMAFDLTQRYNKNPLLRTALVTRDIRKAMRDASIKSRPYVLRAYCDTCFDIAENKGLISHPWRMFFMGHKGDIEARYSVNKKRLPPDMIEEMRASYARAAKLMQTVIVELSETQVQKTVRKEMLLSAGFAKEEIEKMLEDGIQGEELQNAIKQKLLGVFEQNGSRQKVILVTEVENYINNGYEYVAALPNGKVIVKMPF